ncbi:hypothetical protein C366_04285 [Cryptococcus neoformans Tu401-1]|nr:hypothetical protein C366_04285 [Cryptococcus neoformans var. grubii Tu401-1]OXM78330.1 hypothetical protein C364_04269 [Cryptococcus neoformans var. grubii Bt63]
MIRHDGATHLPAQNPHRRIKRDASDSDTFFIPDSSPLISYASSSSSLSPWTSGYFLQTDGYDETVHVTAIDNSTLSFNVTATSLTLLIPTFSFCSATISINASTPVTACASNSTGQEIPYTLLSLPSGSHQVMWNSGPIPPSEQVIFRGIEAQRPIELGGRGKGTNVTIDDTYTYGSYPNLVDLEFEGDWTHLGSGAGMQTSLSEAGDLGNDFNKTLAVTNSKGASITFSGMGSAIYLYGTIGPDYGLAQLSLNGDVIVPSMNLSSPWSMAYDLLWFRTGLDSSQMTKVAMTNLDDSKMALDFIILTANDNALTELSPDGGNSFISSIGGKLILYLVIPLFIIFLISVFTFWFIRRRRRLRRNSRRGSQESTLSLHDSPSPIKDGSEKQWYLPSPRRPKLTPSRRSDRSSLTLSVIDVFIPYDEAKGKKQSNKWYNSLATPSPSPSPQVGRRTERSVFAPAFGLSTVTDGTWPERSKSPDSPQRSQKSDRLGPSGSSSRLGTSNGRKERDEGMMSVLEENDAATSRRTTPLPAYPPEGTFITHYTPSDDGNSVIHGTPIHIHSTNTSPSSRYPIVGQEKATQFYTFRNVSSSPTASVLGHPGDITSSYQLQRIWSSEPPPSPTTQRWSTIAPSDIISIFGAPPASERRMSMMTDHTSNTASYPWVSRPGSGAGEFPPPLPITSTYTGFNLASIIPSSSSGRPTPTINTDLERNPFGLPYMTPRSVSGLGSGGRSSRILTPPKKVPASSWPTDLPLSYSSSDFNPTSASAASYPISTFTSDSTFISTPYGATSAIHFTPTHASPTPWAPIPYTTPVRESLLGGIAGMGVDMSGGGLGWHKRSLSNWSHLTERSAARPDSEVMPFESFIHSLNGTALEEAKRQRAREGA